MHRTLRLAVCGWILGTASLAMADNWPNWRGPSLDGAAVGSGYATSWSP